MNLTDLTKGGVDSLPVSNLTTTSNENNNDSNVGVEPEKLASMMMKNNKVDVVNSTVGKDNTKAAPEEKPAGGMGVSSLGHSLFGMFQGLLHHNKRQAGAIPYAVEELIQQLEKDGQDKITSMTLIRQPVEAYVGVLMNAVAQGRYAETIVESEYDTMFHLGIQINGKYRLEKNEVITFTEVGSNVSLSGSSQSRNAVKEFMSSLGTKAQNEPIMNRMKDGDLAQPSFMRVALPRKGDGDESMSIRSLLDKTRQYMGDDKFTNYSPRHNNCQDFVLGVLAGNDLKTELLEKFVNQDAESIFQELPEYTTGVANTCTDLAAAADNLMEKTKEEVHHLWTQSAIVTKQIVQNPKQFTMGKLS